MNILLCGLQASGKTTFGQQLSMALNCPFIDTDTQIQSTYKTRTGKELSSRQIYKEEGASYFRALERQEIIQLQTTRQTVIALGGGTLEDPLSLEHIKSLGILIYLKNPLEILWQRIVLKGIPSYLNHPDPKSQFYDLAKKRIPLYEKSANFTINCSNEEPTIDHIIKLLIPNSEIN